MKLALSDTLKTGFVATRHILAPLDVAVVLSDHSASPTFTLCLCSVKDVERLCLWTGSSEPRPIVNEIITKSICIIVRTFPICLYLLVSTFRKILVLDDLYFIPQYDLQLY